MGAISVKAPPYLAKGDGATDDTAAIQAAVDASCATSGANKPEVLLPATPGGLCYRTSAPILLHCSLKFNGGGWQQTTICQNYLGPTIIAQGAETGWKPPLASSVAAAWTASHSYAQYKEILDSNGNVEVATTGGTSGGGSHPAWPTTQGGTVTDGGVTWTLAMIGTQLATGSGSALDAVSPEMWPGAGFSSNNATLELGNAGGPNDGALNGLSHFTVEFYFDQLSNTSGSGVYLVSMNAGAPEPSNTSALEIYEANGAQGSCPDKCLAASVDIGGSNVNLQPLIAGAAVPTGTTQHIAITYDGSNVRLFLNGALLKTAAASGNWTVLPYESFMIASNNPGIYPGMQGTQNTPPAYYDSLRVSNSARYTSAFSPPAAKFTADGNTVFLLNFPTGTPTGTIEGFSGVGGSPSNKNVFIPVETSDGGADLNPLYIGNMSLNDNGIWATWMLNSTIENIQINGAGRTCINLHDNDYQDTVRRAFCAVVPFAKTNVGFLFMNQSNNNLYEHLQCDGQYTCIEQAGGSGHYVMPDFTDRGYAVYPLAFMQAQALLDSPELDVEDTAANQLAAVYSNGGYAPVVINGGQLLQGNTAGGAYLAISGGAPFIVAGTMFTGGSPAELLNVIANPSSPVVMHDVIQPSGIALTNAGKSWWLNESQGNQDVGVKFADLPGSVTNGARRYCVDCDPPANPPVACTSAGAKTGAWVNGLNSTWICVP
jgi:Concanavalin A-like lectin/glucanases superfamily/Pectate lyase superfamily protein